MAGLLSLFNRYVDKLVEASTDPLRGAPQHIRDKSELGAAACMNNVERVQELIDLCGLDIMNVRYEGGDTLLMRAARSHATKMVDFLLNHNADIEAKNDKGQTALQLATQVECERAVHLLLKEGADLDAADNEGNTALIIAAQKGNKRLVTTFLNLGANLNAVNKHGMTASTCVRGTLAETTIDDWLQSREARLSHETQAMHHGIERKLRTKKLGALTRKPDVNGFALAGGM